MPLGNTYHQCITADVCDVSSIPTESVHLIVTSPPYPMIGMWDGLFLDQLPHARSVFSESPDHAFELFHAHLDRIWRQCETLLVPGGLICINIGDAVRTTANRGFTLFPNAARISMGCRKIGLTPLPGIVWHKPNNSPTKFMGSGMLPAGAYVTYENESILIFRKGTLRDLKTPADSERRRQSAFFWEERNLWFSDIWDRIIGVRQEGGSFDNRHAAFPLEIPLRLIWMFSLYGDMVLDPFGGTGTTAQAAAIAGRNSVTVDLMPENHERWLARMNVVPRLGNEMIHDRYARHIRAMEEFTAKNKPPRYVNDPHGFPVKTRQETHLCMHSPVEIASMNQGQSVSYRQLPSSPKEKNPEEEVRTPSENTLF